MTTWTSEDTLKICLLFLFVLSFIVVIQQLLSVDARVNANEKKRTAASSATAASDDASDAGAVKKSD